MFFFSVIRGSAPNSNSRFATLRDLSSSANPSGGGGGFGGSGHASDDDDDDGPEGQDRDSENWYAGGERR